MWVGKPVLHQRDQYILPGYAGLVQGQTSSTLSLDM